MPSSPQFHRSATKGTVRKTTETPSTPVRQFKKANMDSDQSEAMMTILMSMQADLRKSVEDQQSFRQSVEQRLSNLESNINVKIEAECKSIREDMAMELVKMSDKIKAVEASVQKLQVQASHDIGELQTRVGRVEESGEREAYSPARTIVATGIPFAQNEDIKSKAKDLVDKGLKVRARIINVERTPLREGNRPGIVKIELDTKEEKIEALRAKGRLATSERYKSVYIRSAQSHEERLLHQNTRLLLKEMGAEQRYRITGSGRLVTKNPDERPQRTVDQA